MPYLTCSNGPPFFWANILVGISLILVVLAENVTEDLQSTSTSTENSSSPNFWYTTPEINSEPTVTSNAGNENTEKLKKDSKDQDIDKTKRFQTSTSKPPTLNKQLPENYSNDEYCECDLQENFCDINCCCDMDCSPTDKQAFSECLHHISSVDKSYQMCFSREYLYKNNTRYEIKTEHDGLFCISRDNYPDRLKYLNQPILVSTNRFFKVWDRKKHFHWHEDIYLGEKLFNNKKPYIVGGPLWMLRNDSNTLTVLEFPASVVTSFCDGLKSVGFMMDQKSSCLQAAPKTESDCSTFEKYSAAKYGQNIQIVISPLLINLTKTTDSQEDAFVNVRVSIIRGEQLSEETPVTKPQAQQNVCENVVKAIEYTVFHNGVGGITQVDCTVTVGDTLINGDPFRQEFIINFVWASNVTSTFKRSGRPGYLLRMPLISGSLKRGTKDLGLIQVDNPEDWLSLISSSSRGYCGGRSKILFRENMKLTCKLSFNEELLKSSEMCAGLQEKVWKSLLNGMQIDDSDPNQMKMYISSYGDPNFSPTNWVPLLMEEPLTYDKKAPCNKILSGVELKIMYSYTGSYENAQAKIIGALIKVNTQKFDCPRGICVVTLKSVVVFHDASMQAVSRLAPPPFLKIKLPQDFFYPFSSGSSTMFPAFLVTVSWLLIL